ncbi:MAG: hypothetical protein ACRDI2_19645, partial [Chloroflexota bacterium]
PGVTGEFFAELTADALAGAIASFRPDRYDPGAARAHAARFAPAGFRERLRAAVEGQGASQ